MADTRTSALTKDPLEAELHGTKMVINLGPSHPAMHGTMRTHLTLDGETIVRADPEIGFLHRGFEKSCENSTWVQCMPYTDRLNYVSAMMNNVGFTLAVEKIIGIDIPERAKYIRVIASEIHRLCDHLTLVGSMAMELGAVTVFLYALEGRELLWDRVSELTGARLTTSYTRIGGIERDLPEGFDGRLRTTLDRVAALREDIDTMLSANRIFVDRTRGTGIINAEDAIDFGFTGPCLRASGVPYDIRKTHPYLVYDRLDFEVPLGTKGDNYDRYSVRMEELRQSDRLLRQALEQIPSGPVILDDWRYVMPPKPDVYGSIEGLIAHFKLVMEGVPVPKGEAYAYTEAANGELGWYIVSNGSGRPYKVHCRAPGIPILSALPHMIEGELLADLIPTFDSINMIGGEVEQ
jgi:NADH-quinone oxidoreductase subunit D